MPNCPSTSKLTGRFANRYKFLNQRLFTRRIGDVSPALRSQIQTLSLAQLESLGEALLDFTAPSDLESWLTSDTAG